jgi:hypothetical protein
MYLRIDPSSLSLAVEPFYKAQFKGREIKDNPRRLPLNQSSGLHIRTCENVKLYLSLTSGQDMV